MWEGVRMIGETCDKGDPSRCVVDGVEMATPSTIYILRLPNSFLQLQILSKAVEIYDFNAHIPLSLPTTTQASKKCCRNTSFRQIHPRH